MTNDELKQLLTAQKNANLAVIADPNTSDAEKQTATDLNSGIDNALGIVPPAPVVPAVVDNSPQLGAGPVVPPVAPVQPVADATTTATGKPLDRLTVDEIAYLRQQVLH